MIPAHVLILEQVVESNAEHERSNMLLTLART